MNSKEVARIYLLETLRIQWIIHITYWKMWSSKIILQSLKATRIQRLLSWTRKIKLRILTAQKMKFSIKVFFNKCDQICSSVENFIFCAVRIVTMIFLVHDNNLWILIVFKDCNIIFDDHIFQYVICIIHCILNVYSKYILATSLEFINLFRS